MTTPASLSAEAEAQRYNVALEHFPEFAAQVGVHISCFALVESYVHLLVSKLTGCSEQDAFVFSGSFLNYRSRVDLLESLAKRRAAGNYQAAVARYFVGRLRETTDLRNRYAHGQYSLTFEGGTSSPTAKKIMHIQTSLYDANKGQKTIVRDLGGLQADIVQFKLLICELHGYVHREEIPGGAAVL